MRLIDPVARAETCGVCGGFMVSMFRSASGWRHECPDHPAPIFPLAAEPLAASSEMVAAWLNDAGDVVLSVGGLRVDLAAADARAISGALAGALALRGGA